jgi:16S rRNA C967 or C1407 C5-methylase (RsmB/RsmF family)
VLPGAVRLYDRVLVDAECTHDGSAKHMLKLLGHVDGDNSASITSAVSASKSNAVASASTWAEFELAYLDPARLATLQSLQRNLLRNGFRHLAYGGTLVYSTCSYMRAQNEEIVEWLTAVESEAELINVFGGIEGVGQRLEIDQSPQMSSVVLGGEQRLQIDDALSPAPPSRLECIRLTGSSAPLSYRCGQILTTQPALQTPTGISFASSAEYGIRLDPVVSGTSGLYIAKITKARRPARTSTVE